MYFEEVSEVSVFCQVEKAIMKQEASILAHL